MTFQYYKIGDRFEARRGDQTFTVLVADISAYQREVEGPALCWVNPPFRTGSLCEFQRQAAQTTHGIRFVTIDLIYRQIASMLHNDDEFVWMMPPNDEIEDFFSSLGISKQVVWRKNIAKNTAHLVYSIGLEGKINVSSVSLSRIMTNDTNHSFLTLFPNGITGFKNIFDPCAGSNPLLSYAFRLGMGYFGVELNSFKALNIPLLKKLIRKYNAEITIIPDAMNYAPNGEIIDAPQTEKYKPEDQQRNFREGRLISNISIPRETGGIVDKNNLIYLNDKMSRKNALKNRFRGQ